MIKLANTSNRDRVCLGALDKITFPSLNVKRTFRGEGGKAVDVSAGHFGQVMCGSAPVTLFKRKQDQLKK